MMRLLAASTTLSSLVICSGAFQLPQGSQSSPLSRRHHHPQPQLLHNGHGFGDGVSLSATGSYLETLTRPSTSTSSSTYSYAAPSSTSTSSSRPSYSRTTNPPTHSTHSTTYEKSNNIQVKFTGPPTPVQHVEITQPVNGAVVSSSSHNGVTVPATSTPASTPEPTIQMIVQPPPVGLTYEAYGDVDAQALLASSTFPIPPDQLVALAKDAIFTRGLGMNDHAQCLADDFVFRGAHVETSKADFVKALQSFSLGDAFRVRQQFFGWIVDPIQPNRVWFMNRQEAEQVKEFYGAQPVPGKKLVLPPECLHVDFNVYGQVKEFGFYTVDRAQGNTGGLGGAFGYFYGVGKPLPFPEAKPYQMSKRRRVFETVGKVVHAVQTKWAATGAGGGSSKSATRSS